VIRKAAATPDFQRQPTYASLHKNIERLINTIFTNNIASITNHFQPDQL
jgi:hypothetical protein